MFSVAHVSDSHNNPSLVRQACQSNADVVLITGDCMNNLGRVNRTEYQISPHAEIKFQQSWYRKQAKKWAKDLGDRPIIAIRGNHDFIDYSPWLLHYGANVHEITDDNPVVEVFGKRWAGFRQVNYHIGEWSGEEHSLKSHIQRAFKCKPDILVTHIPPSGILDQNSYGDKNYGSSELTGALSYYEHNITHHFFGHAHAGGGKVLDTLNIRFINGAKHCLVHEVV